MSSLQDMFCTPEFYPMKINFRRRVIQFVRMSRESYRESVFLDTRTRHLGKGTYEIKVDDLLLAASITCPEQPIIHYILHTTFCCSTLLARYFELLPYCFVLKEPILLTQLALTQSQSTTVWQETFDLVLRLLTRTYSKGQCIVIKPHEPVNSLATKLLAHNHRATATFLGTSLRSFLLSVLKSQERRDWVRRRAVEIETAASTYPSLENIKARQLTDAHSIAYLWLVNRFLCRQFVSTLGSSRLLVLDGEHLVDSPVETLRAVASTASIPFDDQLLDWLASHPYMRNYSKDSRKPYDALTRHRELTELENRYGGEADEGFEWGVSHGAGLVHWSTQTDASHAVQK